MKIFVVYCHPSRDSFTYIAKEEFLKGLKEHLKTVYDIGFNFQS